MHDTSRDKLEIMELFSRYAEAMDERLWDRMVDLYTPDVVAEHPVGTVLKGPQAIVGLISKAIDWLGPTHHTLSNFIIDVDGDRAEARCLVRGYHAGAREHSGKFEETLAKFTASLVRTPQGWRFSTFVEHIVLMLGAMEIFNPNMGSPE